MTRRNSDSPAARMIGRCAIAAAVVFAAVGVSAVMATAGEIEQACKANNPSSSALARCYKTEMDEIRWKRERLGLFGEFVELSRGALQGRPTTYQASKCSDVRVPPSASGGTCTSQWNAYVAAQKVFNEKYCNSGLLDTDPRLLSERTARSNAQNAYEACVSSEIATQRAGGRFRDAFLITAVADYEDFKTVYVDLSNEFRDEDLAGQFGDLAQACNTLLGTLDPAQIDRDKLSCK